MYNVSVEVYNVSKNFTGIFGDSSNRNQFANIYIVINGMKFLRDLTEQPSSHVKYMAAVLCENKT